MGNHLYQKSYWKNPQYTTVRFFYIVVISLIFGTICWRFDSRRFLLSLSFSYSYTCPYTHAHTHIFICTFTNTKYKYAYGMNKELNNGIAFLHSCILEASGLTKVRSYHILWFGFGYAFKIQIQISIPFANLRIRFRLDLDFGLKLCVEKCCMPIFVRL